MDEKQLQALANELAKNLKTPVDLSQFARLLKKISSEVALNGEMTHPWVTRKISLKPGRTPSMATLPKPSPRLMAHWNY